MIASIEFVGHQIAAGAAAKGFLEAFMEFQGQRIDFGQGLFAGMIASSQGADDHGAACHGAAQVTGVTDAAAEAAAQTEGVVVDFYACFLAEGFHNGFAAIKAALKVVTCCHSHFFAKFTHANASFIFYHFLSHKASRSCHLQGSLHFCSPWRVA